MKEKVADKKGQRKRIRLLAGEEVHVGVDTHRLSYHVTLWSEQRQEIVAKWVQPSEPLVLWRRLKAHRRQVGRIVYEAGPTGYSLARAMRKQGVCCDVVAPSRTPMSSAPQAKSDRLDSRKLAMYSAKGMLQPVCVPTPQSEEDRQVVRCREQLLAKRRRVKQQIKSFLLQYGIAQPPGLAHWSLASIAFLRRLKLSVQLRFALDRLLSELAYLNGEVQQVTRAVDALAATERHGTAVRAMQTTPGVGLITSLTVRTELISPERFDTSREVGAMLGLAPQVQSSGLTRREGPLMPTGNRRLRTILVEAAWRWVAQDQWAAERYGRLVHNTGSGKKAIVAMARRLGIILWRISVTGEPYRPRSVERQGKKSLKRRRAAA